MKENKIKVKAAEKISQFYFEIAAEIIGEEEVRKRLKKKIEHDKNLNN